MSGPDFIPAAVCARLKDLRLAGRRAAGGHGFGQHRSRSRGAGLEFAQYRAYEPGDELRQIDWKLYARSDRFFVRESERDSPLTAWVLVDATASMAQGDAARPGWTRLDAARALAACVFELALRQGDRFGLAAISGDGLHLVPPGAGPRHRDRCLLELQGLRARGEWPDETRLRPLWERIGAGQLVLLLGDDFDEGAMVLMEKLSAARREVLNIQLLTAEERDFPFRGGHRFRDPETEAELIGDGVAARADFLARFAAAREALQGRLAASGVRRVEYFLDQPLDAPLRRLLAPQAAERA
ncbi:DUF58 domain-containing protein [Arenimonas sp.]|uniref:DUF58 domain-containing protein n=1 Tax=Arenimonas sp. TaxID=1872635 RepID=UPI0035B460CA